jgi:hypothetical protein
MLTDIQFENVDSIFEGLREVEDPRPHINRRHLFGDLIVISIMAAIAGADGPRAIGTWAANHEAWLRKHLDPPNGIPSNDTFDRLLATLKPAALQAYFASVLPSDECVERPERLQCGGLAIGGFGVGGDFWISDVHPRRLPAMVKRMLATRLMTGLNAIELTRRIRIRLRRPSFPHFGQGAFRG